jgi:hypothetical protein
MAHCFRGVQMRRSRPDQTQPKIDHHTRKSGAENGLQTMQQIEWPRKKTVI